MASFPMLSRKLLANSRLSSTRTRSRFDFQCLALTSVSQVLEGGELTPTQVRSVPRVSWPADSEKLYTLIMLGEKKEFQSSE